MAGNGINKKTKKAAPKKQSISTQLVRKTIEPAAFQATHNSVELAIVDQPGRFGAARCQTDRRNITAMTQRLLDRKMKGVDLGVLKTKTNHHGQTAYGYVEAAVEGKQVVNGRLSTHFWTKLWTMFDFTACPTDALVEPEPGSEEVDEELMENIALGRHKNPAERRCGPL